MLFPTFLILVISLLCIFSCKQKKDPKQLFKESVSLLHASVTNGDTLYVPKGLKAELWAESPLFYNPTNIDIDARGRIWVAEAVNYRDFNYDPESDYKQFEKGDRIVILEDTDDDHRADTSKVFVQDKDLRAPLGIAVLDNKVVVSCSPNMIVYTDLDGDDRPDRKEKFLTGFGGFDHDHGLHAVVAGPDGRWYFNVGNAGPHIVTDHSGWTLKAGSIYTGGTPYNKENKPGLYSDDGQVWVGGLALRIRPDGTGLTVLGHNFRNSYELAVDSYGSMWQNDNDDEVQACRTSWLMEGANAGYFSRDGSRYWRADRRSGQDIPTAHWHQEDPGVMPAGDVTGAGAPTGIVVYESDALGRQYRGMLLSADAGRNEIFGYMPVKSGAGYRLERHKFISSVRGSTAEYVWNEKVEDRDKWFRPSDVAVGTDGAIYVADWYDPIVGGHQMHEKEGYGRIYRISPQKNELKVPAIDLKTTEGQLNALLSPAINVRYGGFIRLRERGEGAMGDVKRILSSPNPFHKARAIWLLANPDTEGINQVESLIDNPDEDIRITAFRALRQAGPENLQSYVRRLVVDPSPAVRREVALAVRDLPLKKSQEIMLHLIEAYDGEDRWYLNALGIALENKEEEFYPVLKDKMARNTDPEKWSGPLTDIVWELHPSGAVGDLRQRAVADRLSPEERKRALTTLGFINNPEAAEAMIYLSENADPEIAQQASWWLEYRKTNEWQYFLVGWKAPTPEYSLKKHPEMLELKNWVTNVSISMHRRIEAARAMAGDSVDGIFLLTLAAQNKLATQIKEAVAPQIFENPDRYVQVLGRVYFDRPETRQSYNPESVAAMKTDIESGRILFHQHCVLCHDVGRGRSTIGPDLTDIDSKYDKKRLIKAIMDPDDAVAFGSEPWIITTRDGRAAYGLLLTDGDIKVLKSVYGHRYIFHADNIDSKVRLSTTLMPDPVTLDLGPRELADLTGYLLNLEVAESYYD